MVPRPSTDALTVNPGVSTRAQTLPTGLLCQVAKLLLTPYAGPESVTLLAVICVVTLTELRAIHTGTSQPLQAPVPTVFALLIKTLKAKYSVFANRSTSAVPGTAMAAEIRAVFGPAAPLIV